MTKIFYADDINMVNIKSSHSYHPNPHIKINPKICGADYIFVCYGKINEYRIRRYLKKIGMLDKSVIHRLNKQEWKLCTSPLFDYKIEVISVRALERLSLKPNYYIIEYFDYLDVGLTALMYSKFKYFKWFFLHDLDVKLGDAKENKNG